MSHRLDSTRKYIIKKDEKLIIYQIEHYNEKANIPFLEYVLFTQNGSMNLSLDICNNVTVKYSIPANINEDEIYKHDPNDDYYQDNCNKHSTEGNVDMTQYDRKNDYNNNNYALCESNCEFLGYNGSTSKVICDCKIKNDLNYKDSEAGNSLNKMDNKKSNTNLGLTQCIKDFIAPEHIKSNGGFYTILFIIIIFIIIFIIYCIKGKSLIENKIDEVIYQKFSKNRKKKKSAIIKTNSISNKKISKKKQLSKKISSKQKRKSLDSKNALFNNKKSNIIKNNKSLNKIITNQKIVHPIKI